MDKKRTSLERLRAELPSREGVPESIPVPAEGRTDEWYRAMAAMIAADCLANEMTLNTSLIQRRYAVGYVVALRILEILSAAGCVEAVEQYSYKVLREYQ